MVLPATRRGGRRLSAAVLSCLLTAVTAGPALAAGPAVSKERLHPPKSVEEGAWWYDKMHIAQAHKTSTGKGVTIALIDSGIDLSVPELQGADIRMGLDCREKRAKPRTGPHAGHGTSQAALLVGNGRGTGKGGAGIRGIAPDATILAYDNDLRPEQDDIQCTSEARSRMFDDAVRRGADIISVAATYGGDVIPAARRAIAAGVVVVGAAGADDVVNSVFPSDMEGAVSVYAVDERAKPWNHQRNTGSPVISAPGVFVGAGGIFDHGWSSTGWSSGTSPATTLTSGALALVKAKYPEATGNQLLQHMVHHTGGDGPYAWDDTYGFGIVSVTEMLQTNPTQWPDENPLGKDLRATLTKYPMSASSLIEDEASPSAGPTDTSDTAGSDRSDETGSGEPETAPAAGETDSAAGVPAWTWPAAALVVAAAAGGVLITRRRRGTTPGVVDETRGA